MMVGSCRYVFRLRKALLLAGATTACALIALTCPSVADAACAADEFCVNYTSTSSTGAAASSSLTWDATVVANGVNRAITVGVAIRSTGSGSIPSVSSATFDSINLAKLSEITSTDGGKRAEMWGLAGDSNVSTGTNSVVVTMTGSAEVVAGAVTFTGVDPTTPFNATSTRSESNTMLSTLAAAGTTSICVDVTAVEGDRTATKLYSDQVERWNESTGSSASTDLRSSGSTRPGQGGRDTYLDWDLDGTSTAEWATAAAEVVPYDSTAIRLKSFGAEAHTESGVALRWRTGGERGTLGFLVYRENSEGDLMPVNCEMVAGSTLMSKATLEAGYSYAWWDEDGAAGDRYWIEEIEVTGGRRQYGPFTARAAEKPIARREPSLTLSRAAGPVTAAVTKPVPATGYSTKSAMQGGLEQQLSMAADPTAIKIGVRERGWYQLDQPILVAAGLDPSVDPDRLQLFSSGQPLPIRVTGANDGRFDSRDAIEFYGLGVDEASTDTRVYWLVAGEEPGRRIISDTSGVVGKDLATVPYTVQLRERLVYVASFANGDENNFFGAVLAAKPVERVLPAMKLDPDATAPASLALTLRGFSEGQHAVRVELNDIFVATLAGADQEEMHELVDLPPGVLRDGDNVLRLIAGGDGDICLVDVIRLQYPRQSVADSDELLVTLPDSLDSFEMEGFTGPGTRVLDVSDPFDVKDLTANSSRRRGGRRVGGGEKAAPESTLTKDQAKPKFKARFALPHGTQRTIHAIGPSRGLEPAWVQANMPSSWNSSEHAADVLMVAARGLIPAVQPLVDFRESQGHTVAVVPIEDAYDEYSFGIKRAAAIRDLVRDAVTKWSEAPKFLILVGDASYDPRDFLGLGGLDLVPTKFVATDAFEAVSDDWFGDVDGDLLADLIVGRFPVKGVADLEAFVAKTIAYEQEGLAWSKALYVSDDDIGQQFETSNLLLKGLLPSLDADDVVVRELGNEAARAAVLEALNQGVDLVSYVGHGSVQTWSGSILAVDMLDQLSPEANPTVFTMMNCMNGYFFDAALDSLAEGLLAVDGGAVAVFAPTGMAGYSPQEPMMAALFEMLEMHADGATFGEAVAEAKQAAGSDDVRRTWVLLGDPMIEIR